MDSQEIKGRYQRLLESYHSGEIDWKGFEEGLREIKILRANLDSEKDEAGDELPDDPTRSSIDALKPGTPNRQTGSRRPGFRGDVRNSPFSSDISFPSGIRSPNETDASKKKSPVLRPLESAEGVESGIFFVDPKGEKLNAGDVLDKRYMLQRLLGHGQCGETWRARELGTDNFVVVKPVISVIQRDDDAWKRIRRAVRQAAALKHPNIAPVYSLEWDDRVGHFIVSAFLDALTLDEYYRRYCRTFKEFPLSAVVRVLWPAAEALDEAHRMKIVHGELKPENVFVGKRCGTVITDFGFTETVRMELLRLGINTDVADSESWRAPEIWLGDKTGPRSDQFSLGALAYRLLTGAAPFRGKTVREVRERILHRKPDIDDDLSDRVNAALQRALAKEPDARFPSCLHFVKELAGDVSGGPHYDRSEDQNAAVEVPRRFWTVLLGLPRPEIPGPLAAESEAERGLFDEDPETTSDPKDGRIPEGTTYPYVNAPKPGRAFSPISNSPARTFLAGGVLAVMIGTVAWLSWAGISGEAPERSGNGTVAVQNPERPDSNVDASVSGRNSSRSDPSSNVSGRNSDRGSANLSNADLSTAPPDLSQWVRQAGQGDVDAQKRLGEIYYFGRGVETDYKKAFEYFRLAAGQGEITSLYRLGRCYELGLGVPRNRTRALEIYREADQKGSEEARDALERLQNER